MKRILPCFVVIGAFLLADVASADQKPAAKPTAQSNREGFNVFKSFRKCGRGIANIATSPFEIPNQMVKEAKKHDTVGGAFGGYVTGIPFGCGWMLYRCGVGLWDVVTGPIPTPTYEKSYIEPEFLFPQDPYVHE